MKDPVRLGYRLSLISFVIALILALWHTIAAREVHPGLWGLVLGLGSAVMYFRLKQNTPS
ncbi:MAG: hypothetical protein GXO27_02185 [Chlorobi bacterium]|nr:hypothetical protein [Chlorobiota bacterium]